MPNKVLLPHLVRDREYLRESGDAEYATPVQEYSVPDDGSFRDGPVHPRVAVVDLDADTHTLRPPLCFKPRSRGRTVSEYGLTDGVPDADSPVEAFETDEFLKLSPFATVLKTLRFFESPEILGRPVRWAFPSEQLLVVPRAGEMKNAFYDRDSGSLQFYYHPGARGFTVYTALSHDIVVHETTHAILDGLAPDLYHAADPQSLALHEALADLAAISQALINEMVVFSSGALFGGGLEPVDMLSRLAEEFGKDVRLDVGASFLRRLRNERSLKADDDSVDEFGLANRPDRGDPHALSQVLSGAVYAVIEQRMQRTKRGGGPVDALEKRFCPAARRVARIVFRALDYLPPGEAGFVDYGRAFLAAAQATYGKPQFEQRALIEEFLRRGIVASPDELEGPPLPDLGLDAAAVDRLLGGGRSPRGWARDHAEALGLPADGRFEVLAPVEARRALKSNPGAERTRESIFRFRWEETEDHDLGGRLPKRWTVVRGTTLVLADDGRVLSVVTTDRGRRADRAALLARWSDEGRLHSSAEALGPDGKPLHDAVRLQITDGVARAIGGGRTLHLARDLA